MTILQDAIKEAERFLKAARAVEIDDGYAFSANATRATAKRASLDLTRKLAELRKAPADNWAK